MYKVNSKLGIKELRDFINQLLFDFYHLIPKLRKNLKKCRIEMNSDFKNKNDSIRTLYLNSYTKPAQKYILSLKSSTSSDSLFIDELNRVYERLSEKHIYKY